MDNIIIEKVINNNIISAYEKSGAEVIVMGRGIGFKKKQGEVVPADQISKSFALKAGHWRNSSRNCWRICRWNV